MSDGDLDRAAMERAHQLDEAGFLVTIRLEVEASVVAKILGTSLRTLRRWRDAGQGPPSSRTVGTVAFYLLVDVLAWAEGTQRPDSMAGACSDRHR